MSEPRLVTVGKKRFLALLLEADPCEKMIDRYLESGELFVLEAEGATICLAVVTRVSNTEYELKNLAVEERFRSRGHARRMLEFLFARYASRYATMLVGTAENGVLFYEKMGFTSSHVVRHFFTDNYPEPILDDGRPCVDMLYLKKNLRPEA